jgi:hypothetical protein
MALKAVGRFFLQLDFSQAGYEFCSKKMILFVKSQVCIETTKNK